MTIKMETWQHRDIITNGIRMHYVTQGEGPLIILLHGFPEFWYSWRHQIPFLAEQGYTVVAVDLRGYNDSDKPRKGYDVATLTRDVAGLLQALNHRTGSTCSGDPCGRQARSHQAAHIVGHDWGGMVAWYFAMHYPEMTNSLIALNAPHPLAMLRELRTLKQLRKSWYIFAFQIPWLPEYMLLRNNANEIGRMLRGSAVQKSAFPREVTAKFQQAMSKPGAMTAALNYYRQLFRDGPWRVTHGTSHVSAPTLLIWGEQDIALGIELTYGLEQWVENITIKRIKDSGHWVQQEQPDKVNQYMLDFLKSLNL